MAQTSVETEDEPLEGAYDGRLLRRLVGYVRPHLGMATLAVFLIVLSALLQLVGPLATAVGIDLYIRPVAESGGSARPPIVIERARTVSVVG